MAVRIVINGFGRIGRLILRAILENKNKNLEIVAINDLASIEANAHLFNFDSTHGKFNGIVKTNKNGKSDLTPVTSEAGDQEKPPKPLPPLGTARLKTICDHLFGRGRRLRFSKV